jgi:predicted ester cyclase
MPGFRRSTIAACTSLKELEAKIQRSGEEAWYKGNVDALDEAYATELAYSDIQLIYDEWINAGDAIAYRYHCRMKHTGTSPSLPIPPTGKDLTLEGCVVVHVKDGKVIEEWEYSDYLGFLQQLGIVPPLG